MDFEYIARDGERPVPICCVARELRTGLELRRWGGELRSPLPVPDDAVVVVYYAPAEMSCFLALNWPLPLNVIDLFAEFRNLANGTYSVRSPRFHGTRSCTLPCSTNMARVRE